MKNQFLNLGKTLTKTEQVEINGGGPSDRRCFRLLRRARRRALRGNIEGADRLLAKYDEIC